MKPVVACRHAPWSSHGKVHLNIVTDRSESVLVHWVSKLFDSTRKVVGAIHTVLAGHAWS